MKYYFLGLATLVAVCVGCQTAGMNGMASRSGASRLDSAGTIARGNDGATRHQQYFAPPASQLHRPGPMVDGPGPGVLNAIGMGAGHGGFTGLQTQVKFIEPEGMTIGWQIPGGYADNQLAAPGRHNFPQGANYRLKFANIPEREGLTLYPTLQVYPSHPETDAFLSHNCVPIQVTDEDLDQVQANNFVTKVIYLPSPRHQELAIAGVETLVSTRLDPGLDPVAEADRRGTILAVLRIGNMDLESADSRSIVAPDGTVTQASHIRQADGEKNEFVAPLPMPISGAGARGHSIPSAMMMGVPGAPGQPAVNPITGGPAPSWGMPITGTPIGLAGPPHLPYGGKAGLKSHTVRNRTKQDLPEPVDHMVIDVKHTPGIKMPPPVRHVEYTEKHFVPRNP
ncbi:MAG: hypothetical protein ACKV0T_11200 [Planctomycetales bacterium]